MACTVTPFAGKPAAQLRIAHPRVTGGLVHPGRQRDRAERRRCRPPRSGARAGVPISVPQHSAITGDSSVLGMAAPRKLIHHRGMEPLTHQRIGSNGITLHVAAQGSGVPVVFCHGFPGLWYSFRHQLPVVAAAGWRALAPDQRGYGASDRPSDPAAYDAEQVMQDMLGLLDALEAPRAVFVGTRFRRAAGLQPRRAPSRARGGARDHELPVRFRPRRPRRRRIAACGECGHAPGGVRRAGRAPLAGVRRHCPAALLPHALLPGGRPARARARRAAARVPAAPAACAQRRGAPARLESVPVRGHRLPRRARARAAAAVALAEPGGLRLFPRRVHARGSGDAPSSAA